AVAHTIALHVADAMRSGDAEVIRAVDAHVASGDADALCVFDARGTRVAAAGKPNLVRGITMRAPPHVEVTRIDGVRIFDMSVAAGDATLAVRLRADEGEGGAPLVRLVALYMTVFALALIVFTYFALTRL